MRLENDAAAQGVGTYTHDR